MKQVANCTNSSVHQKLPVHQVRAHVCLSQQRWERDQCYQHLVSLCSCRVQFHGVVKGIKGFLVDAWVQLRCAECPETKVQCGQCQMNSGSLPCAPHCADPLYHMLESPVFPRAVLSAL